MNSIQNGTADINRMFAESSDVEDWEQDVAVTRPALTFDGIAEFAQRYPRMRDVIIDGYLRRGETCNVIAATKIGKSWLSADLGMSVASGTPWLKKFETTQGVVIYLDFELHPETFAQRLRTIADHREHRLSDLNKTFIPLCLRGSGHDINSLERVVEQIESTGKRVSLIVLDAWYRLLPAGMSENDNAQMMSMYNRLDLYAKQLNCAFLVVHHSSKGNQGDKSVTDTGSGAGAMSRAADTHIVIRPHEEDGMSVMESVSRSFPPMPPRSMFFTWPLWHLSETAAVLASRQSPGAIRQKKTDIETKTKILTALGTKRLTMSQLRGKSGFGASRVSRGLAALIEDGSVKSARVRKKGTNKRVEVYSILEPINGG